MSVREFRERVEAIEPRANQVIDDLIAEAALMDDPLQRVAFWRTIWDRSHGEIYEAVAASREAGLSWSAIAVGYDRSQPSTFSKFGRQK